jgi:hypothetical protein
MKILPVSKPEVFNIFTSRHTEQGAKIVNEHRQFLRSDFIIKNQY